MQNQAERGRTTKRNQKAQQSCEVDQALLAVAPVVLRVGHFQPPAGLRCDMLIVKYFERCPWRWISQER